MTTEKCHSVRLLVHDIIFFSHKNKPWAAINLWSFVLKRKQADFGSGITPTAAIVSICVLSWSLLVTTANLVRTNSLHLINHWGSWNDATIPSNDEFKMYFTNAHAEILFVSTHSVCLVNATAVNRRLSRAGRWIAQPQSWAELRSASISTLSAVIVH